MTRTYYHATDYENLRSILKGGIHKGCDGYVYLTDTPEDATKFLRIRGCRDILVIAVDLEEDMISESFDHSESFFQCKAYIYPEDIHPYEMVDALRYQIS